MSLLIEEDRIRLFCDPVTDNQDQAKGGKDHPENPRKFHCFTVPVDGGIVRGMMNVVSRAYESPLGSVKARIRK